MGTGQSTSLLPDAGHLPTKPCLHPAAPTATRATGCPLSSVPNPGSTGARPQGQALSSYPVASDQVRSPEPDSIIQPNISEADSESAALETLYQQATDMIQELSQMQKIHFQLEEDLAHLIRAPPAPGDGPSPPVPAGAAPWNPEAPLFSWRPTPSCSTATPTTDLTRPPKGLQSLGLIRGPLNPEERLRRRRSGLCFYCGEGGHLLRTCPVRPRKKPEQEFRHYSVSRPSSDHVSVPISLQIPGREVRILAVVDSGACSNFLDVELAQSWAVPIHDKVHSFRVHLADGSSPRSGPVTQEVGPLCATTESGHKEDLHFDLLRTPMCPVILGLPWLQLHDPQIQWHNGKVSFTSPYCISHCLEPKSTCGLVQASDEPAACIPAAYREYLDVFDKKGADQLPPHRPYDCPIELLPGAEIPYGRLFPLSEKELETLQEYIEDNLRKGFIRASSSPAGAGLFFVQKKDGTLRPCIDYRELNRITVKNRYPLPLIPELIQRLRSAKVFSKLDLRGAYNLIRIREGDEWKTAFRTRFGHFEYLVMPFGLCNAPATFQHLVNDIFKDYLDQFLIVYLDDILIFSPSLELHRTHVAKVLATLRRHGLYVKGEKCEFERSSITFLGLIISTEGISMDPQKVQAIREWPAPQDRKGVQRFIGFANFYRRFIRGFSAIVAPITQLTRLHSRFMWSAEAQRAFERLKTLFTTAPVLQHPDPKLPFVLEVDASEVATGAVLSQRLGPKALLHPVAFASRKLSPAEKNYDVGDRELLAIKTALEEWRYLLEGATHPIMIYTDHRNLEYLRTARRLRPRQARWALFFGRFNFHLSYRPGSKNGKADALSRMFPDSPERSEPQPILAARNFLLLQPDLRSTLRQATQQCTDSIVPTLDHSEGLLWKQGKAFVPQAARIAVLQSCHDHKLAGHFGVRKTLDLLRRSFWWPGMAQECKAYVSSCTTCQRNKGSTSKSWGLLRPLPVPDQPWRELSLDFIVELPPSRGFTTILVVVDHLTKMAHFLPMKGTPSAMETADIFVREIVRLHGVPKNITSDRGVQFTSRFWRDLCQSLDINVSLSSAYHPRSNGQTERTNQTLEQYLRCYASATQEEWSTQLPLAEFAYNNACHSSTLQSPFWANYGFHPAVFPDSITEVATPAAQDRAEAIRRNFQELQTNMKSAQEEQRKFFDRGRRPNPPFKTGDRVWLSTLNLRLAVPSRKLGPRFIGPFCVKRAINPVAFELDLPASLKVHPVFHASLLKPEVPSPFPGRVPPPPPPVSVDGELEFEVEAILNCRKRGGGVQYLIKWKGYPPEDSSWESARDVHAPALIRSFHRRFPDRLVGLGTRRLPLGGGHCQGRRTGV